MKSIILAGGSGSRLWPLSRDMYPKQLLSLDNENSLLQQTFLRLRKFSSAENIATVTNIKHFQDNINIQILIYLAIFEYHQEMLFHLLIFPK